jgi:hypothetical protein
MISLLSNPQNGSLIYSEKNLEAIFAAIRQNNIKIASRPLKPLKMGSIARRFIRMKLRGKSIKSQKWQSSGFRIACLG